MIDKTLSLSIKGYSETNNSDHSFQNKYTYKHHREGIKTTHQSSHILGQHSHTFP